uniref:GPN-loop GTPase 2 n=1 Tax=Romanomermis culicivorax TaxID=13658 RepID=A0A915IZB1_ROMCU
MPMFGQIALGPPGSGKSTFCNGMKQFLEALGRRVIICNLDPANEYLPYETCDLDIRQLIDSRDVSKNLNLGPNGSLIYCLDFLEHNLKWLINRLAHFRDKMNANYVLFDFPGQIELFTHKNCLRNILRRLRKEADLQLVTLNLVDIHYCTDAAKFIAVLLTSLNTMIRLETPHLNIISKMDLYEKFCDRMPFNLDYFADVLDLKYILDCIDDDPFLKRFKEMNSLICETIESYGLLSFVPLNIQSSADGLLAVRQLA